MECAADLLKSKIAQLIDLLNISSTIACHGCVCLIASCAQCTMHNAQCTCQTTMLHGTHLCWWVWLASLLFAAFAPLHVARCNCASLSLSYQFFHPDWLHGWLQLPVITGQVAKNVMEWIKIPGNLLQDYHILISTELALNVFTMHANYLSSAVKLAYPPI